MKATVDIKCVIQKNGYSWDIQACLSFAHFTYLIKRDERKEGIGVFPHVKGIKIDERSDCSIFTCDEFEKQFMKDGVIL